MEGTYGILIDPADGSKTIYHIDNGVARYNDIRAAIDCQWVEEHEIAPNISVWVDEEGLVNGRAERQGVFQIRDADGERLGQFIYAGKGLLLTEIDFEDGGETYYEPCGWTKERAQEIASSLTIFSPAMY